MSKQDRVQREDIELKIQRVREALNGDGTMETLRKAMEFLEAEFDQPLTLDMMAGRAKLSVSRLAHRFKEQTGTTLIEYLTWIRIFHSQRMLIQTDWSCLKIASEVGYNNQSYFSRTFRRIIGITPRQYRQREMKNQPGRTRK